MGSGFLERFSSGLLPRYVYGINQYADAIAASFPIDGFIDDYTASVEHLGLPIRRLSDVPVGAMVVSTVSNSRPVTAIRKLQSAGIQDCIDYFSFADIAAGFVPQAEPVTLTREDHAVNSAKYAWVRSLLADKESIKVFDDVMAFRLEANLARMDSYSFCVERQYFEPFVHLPAGSVFVDCGGFDGFTTLEFIRRCPNYGAVHFIEPSSENLTIAKAALAHADHISYYQKGVFDRTAELRFDPGMGSASCISDNGSSSIVVARLDELIEGPVSFIKMDLEGAEPQAVSGAERLISEMSPTLAIAVYHHPSDFWRIPEIVLGFNENYDLHLRHYTEGWAETVMFFAPRR